MKSRRHVDKKEYKKANYDEMLVNDEKTNNYTISDTEARNFVHTQCLSNHTTETQSEVYNPDQDKQELLEIRNTYASLREELSKNGRELIKADSQRLSELIDEANLVFDRVHTTFDASLDSRFISNTADLGVEKVHKLPLLVSEFSLDTYLRTVNEYLSTFSWADIGHLVSSYWSGIETFDYMLGPLDLKKKIKPVSSAQTFKRTKMEDAPVVRPSVVTFGTNEEASSELSKETSENVMKLYSVLETVGSFPFYHFITDPDSFSRTVENLFYVSFLVRDNRARIFIPEYPEASNELFIEAVISEDENYPEEAKSSDFNQMILGMTSKVWRKSIEKYNIVKPFLSYS